MNIEAFKRESLQESSSASHPRLANQVDFCAYAEDPEVYIRNAWTQSNKRCPTMPIGTEIALVFGESALLCSLRKGLNGATNIYARLLPSNIARQEDITIDPWPQWRSAGAASDYFAFDKALSGLPWRWTFRVQDDTVIIVPDALPLTTTLGLQITRPFAEGPPLELHPYMGNWVKSTRFIDRHPPVYPTSPTDAWGWLLPTAPWAFEFEGLRFRSVWEYAVNPILRGRASQPESILERLVRATEHRLAADGDWRCRAQSNSDVVRFLAGQTAVDERGHLYFLALSSVLSKKTLR